MFLVNGLKANLKQYNRKQGLSVYDDTCDNEINIKLCPYNVRNGINYDIVTTPEATGYYIVKRNVDVREGDQVVFNNKTYTILEVRPNYIFNKIENQIISVR